MGVSEGKKALARVETLGHEQNEGKRETDGHKEDEKQVIKAKHDCERQDCNDQDESKQKKAQEKDKARKDTARNKNKETNEENKKKCSRCLSKDITSARLAEARRATWKRIMRKNDVKFKWK